MDSPNATRPKCPRASHLTSVPSRRDNSPSTEPCCSSSVVPVHTHRLLDRRRAQCIYLAAPIPAFDTPLYPETLTYLKELYPPPRHAVLSSRGLFTSTLEWKATYQDKLSGVTGCYLLLFHGFAGYGCKAETEYVAETLGRPVFAIGRDRNIVPVSAWVPSGHPNPSLAWRVLDPRGSRVR